MALNTLYNARARDLVTHLTTRIDDCTTERICRIIGALPPDLKTQDETAALTRLYSVLFFHQFETDQDFHTYLDQANPVETSIEKVFVDECRALRDGHLSPARQLAADTRTPGDFAAEYDAVFKTPYQRFQAALIPR